jgi:hypothetical protein
MKAINSISEYILTLEQENSRLSRLVDTMGEKMETAKQNPGVEEVLALVGKMANAWEPRFDVLPDGIQAIIRAYRKWEKGEDHERL